MDVELLNISYISSSTRNSNMDQKCQHIKKHSLRLLKFLTSNKMKEENYITSEELHNEASMSNIILSQSYEI